MPTTIFLRGGVKFTLRGDGPGTVIKRLFRPMAAGIAMGGHLVEFRWRDRLFVEAQPEADLVKAQTYLMWLTDFERKQILQEAVNNDEISTAT